jgi:hypothetical protein
MSLEFGPLIGSDSDRNGNDSDERQARQKAMPVALIGWQHIAFIQIRL